MGFFDKLTGGSSEETQRLQDRVHRLESENDLIKQDFASRLARLEGMLGWLRVLGACTEREPALDTAWSLFQDFLGMKKGALYLPSEKGWTPLRQIGFFPVAPVILREEQSALGRAMKEGIPLITDQEAGAPDDLETRGSGVIPDVLRAFPFATMGGHFGALIVCEKARTSFSEAGETEFGMTVAFLLGMHFERVESAKNVSHLADVSLSAIPPASDAHSRPLPPEDRPDEKLIPTIAVAEQPALEPGDALAGILGTGDEEMTELQVPLSVLESTAQPLSEGNPHELFDLSLEVPQKPPAIDALLTKVQEISPVSEKVAEPSPIADFPLPIPLPEFPPPEKSEEIFDLNLDLPGVTSEPQTTLPARPSPEQPLETVATTEISQVEDLLSPGEVFGISLDLPAMPHDLDVPPETPKEVWNSKTPWEGMATAENQGEPSPEAPIQENPEEDISRLLVADEDAGALILKDESLSQPIESQNVPPGQPSENTLIIDEPPMDLGDRQGISLISSDDPGHLVLTEETTLHIPTLIDEPSPGDLEITFPDETDLGSGSGTGTGTGTETSPPSEPVSELRISDAELHLELPMTIDERVTIEEPVSSGKSLEWELAKKSEIEKKWQDLSLEDAAPQIPESGAGVEKPHPLPPVVTEALNFEEDFLESPTEDRIPLKGPVPEEPRAVSPARDLVSQPKVLPMANPLPGSGVDLLGFVVLFLKIRGFTPLIGQLPPDKTMEILGRYFSSMTAIVLGHQGMVEKLIGDTVMATFKMRSSDANPAIQAFNAAVGIRRRFDQIIREALPNTLETPALGVGLHYQELMLGLGEDETDVVETAKDEGLRLASRLSSLADDGEILFDKSVYQCLQEGQDSIPPQEKILLKDENDPLKIYSCQSETMEPEEFSPAVEVNSSTLPGNGSRGEAANGLKASLGRRPVPSEKQPVEAQAPAETAEPLVDPGLSAAIDFLKLEEAQEDRDTVPPA